MSYEEWSYNNEEGDNYYRVGMEYIDLENVIGAQRRGADMPGLHQSPSGSHGDDLQEATGTYTM